MYIVRDSNSEIIIISTKESDARAFLEAAEIDKQSGYTIEDTSEDEYYDCKYIELQDGIGEGQPS